MTAQLFIPDKIKVGFQKREGTFTGTLAYVIYYDEKNKLRKESSWNTWRDTSIEPLEFDNTPMNGFIFNKGIQRSSEWFGSGRSVFRVFAPHDFEFEINSDNLINLLMHSDVSKREILEQCVFAWAGTELVLLPTNSVEYQQSIEYTAKQSQKVSTKELVRGRRYNRKKSSTIETYIGYFEWWKFDTIRSSYKYEHQNKGKKHIFWDGEHFRPLGASVLSSAVSDDIVDNYAELVDNFFSTHHSQRIIGVTIDTNASTAKDANDRYRYPELYTISADGKRLSYIYPEYYSYTPLHKKAFNEYAKTITYDGKFNSFMSEDVRYLQPRQYSGYPYYGADTYSQSRHFNELHRQLMDIAEAENIVYEEIDKDQYTELMTKLGYGIPKFVLENGRACEYKNRFYYGY